MHEIVLQGNSRVANPFETDCAVTFRPPSGPANAVAVKAFYDGGDTWRARLYVTEVGPWEWSSSSADDPRLNDKGGSFSAVGSNLRGKLRQHRRNSRQWMTDDGRTFLNLSDTAYILFRSPNDPKQPVADDVYQRYVKDAVALGITAMRAGGCGGYAGWRRRVSGIGPNYDRSNWCWEKDYGQPDYYKRFDLDRFQTTDRRLEWLLNRHPDMYIQLIMFGKTSTRDADRCVGALWDEIPGAYKDRTVDYMLARWSAWPQVFYQIVNDTNFNGTDDGAAAGATNQDMIREIGAYMAGVEPFGTLRSAGAKRREDNPFILQSDWDAWHTYLHIERYSEVDASVCDYYYNENKIPVHLYYGEDWYEGGPFSGASKTRAKIKNPDYYYRRMFWSVLLSGGSPNYGSRYAVLHPYSQTGSLAYETPKHTYTEPLVGLNSLVHLRNYFEQRRIDLALFEPDDGATRAIPPPKPEPTGPSRAQCARRDHDEYLVYLPCAADGEMSGGEEHSREEESRAGAALDPHRTPGVRVDLREVSGAFNVEWSRVENGAALAGAPVEGGAYRLLTSPWKGVDVVLRLQKSMARQLKRTDILPHRGGAGEYPENTLYAYVRNLRDGFSLDMDIRKTGDGDIVVIHDETTGDTCDEDWIVAEKTVADLKPLDAAYRFDPKGDQSFPLRGQGITIPTLEEVFRLFSERKTPSAILWIDTKDDEDYPFEQNQALYDRLVGLIHQHNLWNEAHIEVSRTEEAEALRSRDPRVRVVFWGGRPDVIRDALKYPHYVRIGVSLKSAAAVAAQVKAAGKKLHVTDKRFTAAEWDELRPHAPDSLGTDYYMELAKLVDADEGASGP